MILSYGGQWTVVVPWLSRGCPRRRRTRRQRCARDRTSRHTDVCAVLRIIATMPFRGNYAAAKRPLTNLSLWRTKKDASFWKAQAMGCTRLLIGPDWGGCRRRPHDHIRHDRPATQPERPCLCRWYLSYVGESLCETRAIRRRVALRSRSDDSDGNNQGKLVRGRGRSHRGGNRAEVAGAGCGESAKHISSAHSPSPVNNKPNPGNSAPP